MNGTKIHMNKRMAESLVNYRGEISVERDSTTGMTYVVIRFPAIEYIAMSIKSDLVEMSEAK